MNEADAKRILEGLRVAMMTESDGHSFYKMASLTVEDEKGREMLGWLAAEELKHFQWLKAHRTALEKTGSLDHELVLATPDDIKSSRSIFSKDIRNRLDKAQFEMTALSIGMQLELNSINYYRELAGKESLEEPKKFFALLADWEQYHYELLLEQYDDLKEDYWAKAGFAPF